MNLHYLFIGMLILILLAVLAGCSRLVVVGPCAYAAEGSTKMIQCGDGGRVLVQ